VSSWGAWSANRRLALRSRVPTKQIACAADIDAPERNGSRSVRDKQSLMTCARIRARVGDRQGSPADAPGASSARPWTSFRAGATRHGGSTTAVCSDRSLYDFQGGRGSRGGVYRGPQQTPPWTGAIHRRTSDGCQARRASPRVALGRENEVRSAFAPEMLRQRTVARPRPRLDHTGWPRCLGGVSGRNQQRCCVRAEQRAAFGSTEYEPFSWSRAATSP
jgi:hypothetical protein